MGKNSSFLVATVIATSLGAGAGWPAVAASQSNPVDRVSNPAALDYADVEVAPKDLDELFVRDGVVTEPQAFKTITPGIEQTQVRTLLGAPLRQGKREWDYNFKLRMRQSQNYLVCQYKVVFDEHQLVRDTIWRRRQCQQLAASGTK